MHIDETEESTSCVVCDSPVDPSSDRCFGFGEDSFLCWGCAVARGGVYDAEGEVWDEAPDVVDLLADAAQPASPLW